MSPQDTDSGEYNTHVRIAKDYDRYMPPNHLYLQSIAPHEMREVTRDLFEDPYNGIVRRQHP